MPPKSKKKPQSFSEYLQYQARLSLVPISMPLGLNDYFSDVVPHLGNVFQFMRRYVGQDIEIKKMIEVYDSLPDAIKRNPQKVDLDYIADKANVERVVVKERILVALSRYAESKMKLTITMYAEEVIKEMVALALDSNHPDSQKNKELIAEYLGIKAIPKSASININNFTDNSNKEVNIGEIQPMHESLSLIEKAFKEASEIRALKDSNEDKFIDIDEVGKVDKMSLELVAGEDYLEDEEEDDDEMEEDE